MPPEEGVWEDWLLKIQDEARTERVTAETPGRERAVLRFRRLSCTADGALLEIEPETGRMHQIRVQAATRGWPVRGDFLYGARLPFGPPAELPRDRIIALHARSLTFLHPIRFEPLTVTAPLPEVWRPWAPATTHISVNASPCSGIMRRCFVSSSTPRNSPTSRPRCAAE